MYLPNPKKNSESKRENAQLKNLDFQIIFIIICINIITLILINFISSRTLTISIIE